MLLDVFSGHQGPGQWPLGDAQPGGPAEAAPNPGLLSSVLHPYSSRGTTESGLFA